MQGVYVGGKFLNLYLSYISKRWGPLGCNSCIKEIGLEKSGKIEDNAQYPISYFCALLSWLAKEKGEEHVVNAGKFVASYYFQKTQDRDIKRALQRVTYAISESFSGAYVSIEVGEKEARAYVGNINFNGACCKTWLGILKGLAEQLGVNAEVSEIECQAKNGKFCCFLLTW